MLDNVDRTHLALASGKPITTNIKDYHNNQIRVKLLTFCPKWHTATIPDHGDLCNLIEKVLCESLSLPFICPTKMELVKNRYFGVGSKQFLSS